MNTITLLPSRGEWIARYSGPHSYPVIARYGTCEQPTGVASTESIGRVAERVGAANPGVCIASQAVQ